MKKQIIVLFHLGYWSFYLAMLLLVFIAVQVGNDYSLHPSYIICIVFSFIALPSFLGFYAAYFFLFRNYIQQRKLRTLLSFSLVIILFIAAVSGGVAAVMLGREIMFKNGWTSFFSESFLIAFIALINGTIGFVLRGFISWFADLKIKEKLQQHTHVMELELIKSKLDPHFLFNTINNIDGMMMLDVEVASDYLDKLSTILRFMLYESKVEKIPLSKELEYIQKYIDLQKIRTTNADFVYYTVEGLHFKHQIPTMLFIPFIENAFKHVVSKKDFHAIEIHILIEKEKIIFSSKNKFNPNSEISKEVGGVGNELIEKRLQLLYPDRHQLETSTIDEIYSVQLTILTHEN